MAGLLQHTVFNQHIQLFGTGLLQGLTNQLSLGNVRVREIRTRITLLAPCNEEDALHAFLGYQRPCRTALALPRNGDALLVQPGAKISLVLAAPNLLSGGAQFFSIIKLKNPCKS